MDALADADQDSLQEVEGVGPELAESIHSFFHSKAGRKTLDALRAVGVQMKEPKKAAAAGPQPFADKSIVVTGTLNRFSRKEAQDLIASLGGKAAGIAADAKSTSRKSSTESGRPLDAISPISQITGR